MEVSDGEKILEFEVDEMIGADINSLCRVCGFLEDDFAPIYDNGEDSEFGVKISTYLPIKVSPDDILPLKVCLNCTDLIQKWHTLYEHCIETDIKFRAILVEEKLDDAAMTATGDDNVEIASTSKSSCEVVDNSTKDGIGIEDVSEEGFISMNVSSIVRDESTSDETFLTYTEETETDDIEEESSEKQHRIFKSRTQKKCPLCKIRPQDREKLNEHLKRKHIDQIFHCEICNVIEPRAELIAHMTKHALESVRQSICTETVPKKASKKLTCIKCGKIYANLSAIKYHMNAVHAKIKTYKCDLCDKLFSCKRILSNHKRSMHQKERTYKCEICGKMFKTDSTLFAHKKIHSETYLFDCEICGKKFKFKHHLNTHLAQHTTEKNYSCKVCHKNFSTQNNLSKHMKTHSTTLDFKCHICGVRMKQRRYLQEHMKRVHQTTLARGSAE